MTQNTYSVSILCIFHSVYQYPETRTYYSYNKSLKFIQLSGLESPYLMDHLNLLYSLSVVRLFRSGKKLVLF